MNREKLRTLQVYFQESFEGFNSFADMGEAFQKSEDNYKREAIAKFQSVLGDWISSDADSMNYSDVLGDIKGCLLDKLPDDGQKQNFTSWRDEAYLFNELLQSEDNQHQFIKCLHALLQDAANGRSVDDSLNTLLTFLNEQNCPANMSRIIPTLFLFLIRPDKFIYMKPTVWNKFCILIEEEKLKRGAFFSIDYLHKMESIAESVKLGIAEWTPRDMVDVQSFIFCTHDYTQATAVEPDLASEEQSIHEPGVDDQSVKKSSGVAYLNQIFYGPPGTGKTYNTVIEAVRVCEPDFEGDYEEAKPLYDDLKEKGRIEFITFHQSYGYEEFIEGIRAETIENDHGESTINYEVKSGVFKHLAKKASASDATIREFVEVFKAAVIDRVSKDTQLEIPTKTGFFLIKEISERSIFFDKQKGDSKHSLAIKTLMKIYDAGENNVIVGGLQTYYESLLKYLNNYATEMKSTEAGPFVLVIDEINRGNISKIFGELITLTEPDKRIGEEHAMTVRLPVSGETFGVPNNLHIIGTMNTADRSIAMMDTALRRRFEFKEMMPNPCLLHVKNVQEFQDDGVTVNDWESIDYWINNDEWDWNKDYEDEDLLVEGVVNLRRLLYAMNQRIEVLYDREHTIGHAYFMSLMDASTIEDLASVFANKVIPLLAEYFFEDWEKIRMVLGDNQKKDQDCAFIIESKEHDYTGLFGNVSANNFSDEGKTYQRNIDALNKPESYIGIYKPDTCVLTEKEEAVDHESQGDE